MGSEMCIRDWVSEHPSGHDSLLKYERLSQEAKGLHPDLRVDWTATGELRWLSLGVLRASWYPR